LLPIYIRDYVLKHFHILAAVQITCFELWLARLADDSMAGIQ